MRVFGHRPIYSASLALWWRFEYSWVQKFAHPYIKINETNKTFDVSSGFRDVPLISQVTKLSDGVWNSRSESNEIIFLNPGVNSAYLLRILSSTREPVWTFNALNMNARHVNEATLNNQGLWTEQGCKLLRFLIEITAFRLIRLNDIKTTF